jgi:prepilin-type N-terminal cleavage/methylation domain-containing protein
MRIATTQRRPGVTLIEVLVAIFVMAIGLMALLTLFPLGALEMAQAIKDERSYDSSYNAGAAAEAFWKRSCEFPGTYNGNPSPDPMVDQAMQNPDPTQLPPRSGLAAPSYPAYVDPFGSLQYTGNAQTWIAATPGLMPRTNTSLCSPPPVGTPVLALSGYSNLDDITFYNDNQNTNQYGLTGTPRLISNNPNVFQRDNRYSWALVLQRPDCSTAGIQSQTANLTVVVYSGRSLALSPTLGITGENAYSVPGGFSQASRDVTLSWGAGQDKPAIRRGGWILDAMMVNPNNPPMDTTYSPHAYFYRVVNVTDPGAQGAGTMDLELQTYPGATTPNGASGNAVVLDNVVEVFVKNSLHP